MVMAIIGILATVVVLAINPARQMATARNTQRMFDVNSILNAFGQYSVENGGFFQPKKVNGVDLLAACAVSSTPKKLCRPTVPHGTGVGACGRATVQCVYSAHLVNAFLSDIPDDPFDDPTSLTVNYLVSSISPGRFRVDAPGAENSQIIGAMR